LTRAEECFVVAPRANWKGYLKLGELTCAVALHTAASTSERISFHMLNRKTGNRLNREFVDSETGKTVERDDQVKGYEVSDNNYVELEAEEVASAVPDADRMLEIEAFVACGDVDNIFFDKPYYLAPADKASAEMFALIHEGLAAGKVAAIARTVLFRRFRTLLIRPHERGFVANTLSYDYEVRPAGEAFDAISKVNIEKEMLELAGYIIKTKKGRFDPAKFDDRYETALAEMVKAKIEGRKVRKRQPPKETKASDLLDALRRSARAEGKPAKKTASRKPAKRTAAPMRRAG
jgi:DNA end-binding protein Ku